MPILCAPQRELTTSRTTNLTTTITTNKYCLYHNNFTQPILYNSTSAKAALLNRYYVVMYRSIFNEGDNDYRRTNFSRRWMGYLLAVREIFAAENSYRSKTISKNFDRNNNTFMYKLRKYS